MRRPLVWIAAALAVVVLVAVGLGTAFWLTTHDRTKGGLDTSLSGVSVSVANPPTTTSTSTRPKADVDRMCWTSFGGDPQRSLARPGVTLGLPARDYLWTRILDDYVEYPPSYCNGMLYVNSFRGDTWAIDAASGKVRWKRHVDGLKPSTPAIDGARLIVTSQSKVTGEGWATALDRRTGRVLWQLRTPGKVESSPVVVDGVVYFGSTDGRLFAVVGKSGRVRWAYNTGGRINASPSVYGGRVCISTYAGSILCLRRSNGERLWITYVKRDAFRYESFYASPSTDGRRLYTVARSGKVVALDARTGRIVWTGRVGAIGYTTPAIAAGRVFVGGFDGRLRAYRATNGTELWSTYVGGRILGAPVVVGGYVFFSTLEKDTYAARVRDGKIVWHLPMGRYSPGIATERTYYFSLNGRLLAFPGRNTRTRRG